MTYIPPLCNAGVSCITSDSPMCMYSVLALCSGMYTTRHGHVMHTPIDGLARSFDRARVSATCSDPAQFHTSLSAKRESL